MQSLKKTQQQTKLFLCLLNKAWKNSDKSRRSRVCPDKARRRSPHAMEMQFSGPGLICSSFKPPGLGDHRAWKSIKEHFSALIQSGAEGWWGSAVLYKTASEDNQLFFLGNWGIPNINKVLFQVKHQPKPTEVWTCVCVCFVGGLVVFFLLKRKSKRRKNREYVTWEDGKYFTLKVYSNASAVLSN